MERVEIGERVLVGGNCRLFDHDFHATDPRMRRSAGADRVATGCRAVVIEDDVFIGTNCIVLKGVRIGAGSVIGAGAVVTLAQIPAGSLVAGNPARILGPAAAGRPPSAGGHAHDR
jgi:acetyltransferase-like isoleucine patch superfamily enzyme